MKGLHRKAQLVTFARRLHVVARQRSSACTFENLATRLCISGTRQGNTRAMICHIGQMI